MMLYIIFALMLFCIIIILFALTIKRKGQNFSCESINELYNTFGTYKERFSYQKLNNSKINENIVVLFKKGKLLFCEKYLYQKKDYLITLSKIIDLKINKSKQKFRSKNNLVLIDEISSVVAKQVLTNNCFGLFKLYRKLKIQYQIKQKEEKMFKALLGQKLLNLLSQIENEIQQINFVIKRAQTCSRLKSYKKIILNEAQVYSIKKFNPNSGKILYNFKENLAKSAENLYGELLNAELKIKIIITYLMTMFS